MHAIVIPIFHNFNCMLIERAQRRAPALGNRLMQHMDDGGKRNKPQQLTISSILNICRCRHCLSGDGFVYVGKGLEHIETVKLD